MTLDKLVRGMFRRWYILLAFALLGGAAAYFYNQASDRGSAQAKVAVIEPALTRATREAMQAQVTFDAVLQSQELSGRVIRQLGLEGITPLELSRDVSVRLAPSLIPNVITPLYVIELKYSDETQVVRVLDALVAEGSRLFLELNLMEPQAFSDTYGVQLTSAADKLDATLDAIQAFHVEHGLYDLGQQINIEAGLLQSAQSEQRNLQQKQIYNLGDLAGQQQLLADVRERRTAAQSMLDDLGVKAADYDALRFELNLAESILQRVSTSGTEIRVGQALSANGNANSSSSASSAGARAAASPTSGNRITSPIANGNARGQVSILGTAVHPQFLKYELAAIPADGSADWRQIGVYSSPVTDGQLGVWDTSGWPETSYILRLRVVRQDTNYDQYYMQPVWVDNAGVRPEPEELAAQAREAQAVIGSLNPIFENVAPESRSSFGAAVEAWRSAQARLLNYQLNNDATAIMSRLGSAVGLVNDLADAERGLLQRITEAEAEGAATARVLEQTNERIALHQQRLEELTALQPLYDRLQIELQLARGSYSQIEGLARQQALNDVTVTQAQVKTLEPATPQARGATPLVNMIIGLALGGLLGLALVYLLTYFDRKVYDAQDAEALFDAPVIATIRRG